VIFEKLGSRRIISHDQCNYTCSTRELHKREELFLAAELPEAFLPAREKTLPKTEVSTRVRNELKFVSFFFFQKCKLLSKKSLNVTEKAFRRRLGEGLKIPRLRHMQQVLSLNNKGEKGTFAR